MNCSGYKTCLICFTLIDRERPYNVFFRFSALCLRLYCILCLSLLISPQNPEDADSLLRCHSHNWHRWERWKYGSQMQPTWLVHYSSTSNFHFIYGIQWDAVRHFFKFFLFCCSWFFVLCSMVIVFFMSVVFLMYVCCCVILLTWLHTKSTSGYK